MYEWERSVPERKLGFMRLETLESERGTRRKKEVHISELPESTNTDRL